MEKLLEYQLNYIIENKKIKTVFQPIISLRNGVVFGHEALTRLDIECEIKNPLQLFELSEKYNRVWELELLCRTKALETAYIKLEPPYDRKLFINVNPNIMNDDNFQQGFTKEYLMQYNITPDDIIFEITEREAIKDMASFQKIIDHYKDQQYKIAIDDAGAGYSGLNLISDIRPHLIKLDLKLVRDIDKDYVKYALVKSMVELSRIANISLIAEGIETKEELETLIALGVHYGQGYYIQKPKEKILNINSELINLIVQLNIKKNMNTGMHLNNIKIETLCLEGKVIKPQTKVEKIAELFKENNELMGLCVVQNGYPKGIITKTNFYLQLGSRYGYSLNQNKQASTIMDTKFLQIDYQTPISAVSKIAMSRSNDSVYDFVVITKENKYFGIVTIKDLLQKTTAIEVLNAKHQNPLTGLPGNLIIEKTIKETLTLNIPYSIMYFDIDHFKAFNDKYGFENGDLIIKMLANIMTKQMTSTRFVGHIGGDDFLLICNPSESELLAKIIINEFELQSLSYYHEEDLKKGYILSENRHGIIEKFPLVSLSVAVLTRINQKYKTTEEVTERLAEIKKSSKKIKGSCYYECS